MSLLDNWFPGDGHVHTKYSRWDFAYLRPDIKNVIPQHEQVQKVMSLPPSEVKPMWRVPDFFMPVLFLPDSRKPSVEEMVRAARDNHMRWVMVTDHETMFMRSTPGTGADQTDPNDLWGKMARECGDAGERLGMTVVPGEELGGCNWHAEDIVKGLEKWLKQRFDSSIMRNVVERIVRFDDKSFGHCLCYGLKNYITSGSELTCANMLRAAQDGSRAYFVAHPEDSANYPWDLPWEDYKAGQSYDDAHAGYHGIEVYNHGVDSYAEVAPGCLWDIHLGRELVARLSGRLQTRHVAIGNSDAHWDGRKDYQSDYPGKGFSWLYMPDGITEDAVLGALAVGRCVASQSLQYGDQSWRTLGPLVACRLATGDRSAGIGDTIEVQPNQPVTLDVQWAGPEPMGEIIAFGIGGQPLCALDDLPVIGSQGNPTSDDVQLVQRMNAQGLEYVGQTRSHTLYFTQPGYVRLVGKTVSGLQVFTNPIWVTMKP